MSPLRPVLILAGTSRVVVAIARCLHRHGIAVDVAQCAAPGQAGIASHAIRKLHRLPDFASPEQVFRVLSELIDQYGYDTLIPTTDEALTAVARSFDGLRQRVYPGCPRPEIVNAVLDKRLTLRAAAECGMRVPFEYQFKSLAELEKDSAALRFPLIGKPASKVEEPDFAMQYFHSVEELREAFLSDPSLGSRTLFQEFCPGYGVGIEVLIWDGEIHAIFQHRRLKELPSTGGVSVLAEAQTPDPELVKTSQQLLRRLNWQGVAMVEFRYAPDSGTAVLMEVNGRYWGSLPLSVNAGVEFPYYEWQLAHGHSAGPVAAYAPGFRTLWRVGDAMRFVSLISRWRLGRESFATVSREGWALIADACSRTPDALWKWGDPKPALLEFQARILKPALRPGTLLKLLPAGLARQVTIYRYYGLHHGLRHTYLIASYALGLRRRDLKPLVRRSASVLFVCSGNIMRSPLAAALLAQRMKNARLTIESAGVFACAGGPADPTAAIAAREIGVSLDNHVSSTLSAEMVDRADIIFVMDHLNEAVLLNRFPHAAQKTFLLGACSSVHTRMPAEILDPYAQGLPAVRKCYREVQNCVQTLIEWLSDSRGLAFHDVDGLRRTKPEGAAFKNS